MKRLTSTYLQRWVGRFNRHWSIALLCISSLCDWPAKPVPLSSPIKSKTKTQPGHAPAHSAPNPYPPPPFPHNFAPVACNCTVSARCDWSELLLWAWFYDTRLKTTLKKLALEKQGQFYCREDILQTYNISETNLFSSGFYLQLVVYFVL